MTRHRNKLVVLAAAEAFNRGDLRELRWLIAGPDRWLGGLAELRQAFPDGRVTIEDLIAEDDRVVERWTFSGTHLGTFLGRGPTGRRLRWSGISIYRVALGQIVERWALVDTQTMYEQLDAPPEQPIVGELLPGELEPAPVLVQ